VTSYKSYFLGGVDFFNLESGFAFLIESSRAFRPSVGGGSSTATDFDAVNNIL
jgi:hypothetical protein